jgi:hypothetical protein
MSEITHDIERLHGYHLRTSARNEGIATALRYFSLCEFMTGKGLCYKYWFILVMLVVLKDQSLAEKIAK